MIGSDRQSENKEAKILIVSYRAMTHSNDAQCRPVRLDQYVNQDPRLIFKARLVFKARLLFKEIRVFETWPLLSSQSDN